ncbi:hypothetical protein BC832DRAFT_217292 [Gaertneriomyces semiglobifer]|nr:hypothetical protein BC832DRAFT_217292 [Gaertneriomyces semiglobifer]
MQEGASGHGRTGTQVVADTFSAVATTMKRGREEDDDDEDADIKDSRQKKRRAVASSVDHHVDRDSDTGMHDPDDDLDEDEDEDVDVGGAEVKNETENYGDGSDDGRDLLKIGISEAWCDLHRGNMIPQDVESAGDNGYSIIGMRPDGPLYANLRGVHG